MDSKGKNVIIPLQHFRAYAALWVMLFHYGSNLPTDTLINTITSFIVAQGFFGVDIFFVISGFIVCRSYAHRQEYPLLFLVRRCTRVFSGYWLVLLVYWVWMYCTNTLQSNYNFWLSFFLIPQSIQDNPINVTWTLYHEVIFYGLVVTGILFPVHLRKRLVFGVLLVLFIMLTYCALRGGFSNEKEWWGLWMQHNYWLSYIFTPYLFEFAAGGMLYHFTPSLKNAKFLCLCALAGAIAANHYVFNSTLYQGYYAYFRVLIILPFAVLCVIVATQSYDKKYQSLCSHALQKVGNASYSLYLLHLPLLVVFRYYYDAWFLIKNTTTSEVMLFAFVVIIIAYLWYEYIERPFLFLYSKHLQYCNTFKTHIARP